MFRPHLVIAASLALGMGGTAFCSDLTVILTPPTLKDGSASLADLLRLSIDGFNDDITQIIAGSLDKPLFMEGFGGAASTAALVPGAIHDDGLPLLVLGSAASIYAEKLSTDSIAEISSMNSDSDLKSGMCLEPLVLRGVFPLTRILPGLQAGARLGFMDAEAGAYGVWAFSAGLSAGYRVFRAKKGLVGWDGLSVETGADYAINRITADISPGVISKDIPFDPDRGGPLLPVYATLTVDPLIRASVESSVLSFKLQATTGFTFFDALSLFAGTGLTLAYAKAGIAIAADEEINVEGYLGELVETPGRIAIEGTASERSTVSSGLFFVAGTKFKVGAFDLSVPLVWKPFDALGLGVFLGVHF